MFKSAWFTLEGWIVWIWWWRNYRNLFENYKSRVTIEYNTTKSRVNNLIPSNPMQYLQSHFVWTHFRNLDIKTQRSPLDSCMSQFSSRSITCISTNLVLKNKKNKKILLTNIVGKQSKKSLMHASKNLCNNEIMTCSKLQK